MMEAGKYYSVNDLASLSGENHNTVLQVVDFLAKYGFVDRVGSVDSVYAKSKIVLAPSESIEILKAFA
jgi:hypothetical protein